MAAKLDHSENRVSPKDNSPKTDSKKSISKSFKKKFCKLLARVGKLAPKTEVKEISSPSFFALSPKVEAGFPETKELPSKNCIPSPDPEKFCSSEAGKLSQEIKELPSKTDELSSNVVEPLLGPTNIPSDITKVPLQDTGLPQKTNQLCFNKGRDVQPEVFIFPDVRKQPSEVQEDGGVFKPRRFKSEGEQRTFGNAQQQRQRMVSVPCINKYAQIISARGIQLTSAANELSEEQCRLLYEDIFKPLDVFSILLERRKKNN